MRRSSLPNLKDNLVVTQSNVRFPHSPNVSRSWSPREIRVRSEDRLARSVGDRVQEKKVLEWCKRNNLNIIRKLPKLDSAILTSKDLNAEKFVNFVGEAKIIEREPAVKPPDYSKERSSSNFCQFCQREIPKTKRRRRRPTFFTSPYYCEHCGASNDIYEDSDNNVSSSDSEQVPTPRERVRDTIRRGNPVQVIDHRTFSESKEKLEDFSEKEIDSENDEDDIDWISESAATSFDVFQGNLEEKFSDMDLCDNNGRHNAVFLTETTVGNHGGRLGEVKMAWDDESSNQFAEISRTIVTDDGMEDDATSEENLLEDYSQKSEINSKNSGTGSLFPESESTGVGRLSPTPPSLSKPGGSRSSRNFRSGDQRTRRNSGLEIATVGGENTSDSNDMNESPIANRSVGLTRVALMRLTRQSRSRDTRSLPTSPRFVAGMQKHGSHSHDTYSFHDAVSPELKSVCERKIRPNSSGS